MAELEVGVTYRRFKHCVELRGGVVERIDYGENDLCCENFAFADSWMRSRLLQHEGPVGAAA